MAMQTWKHAGHLRLRLAGISTCAVNRPVLPPAIHVSSTDIIQTRPAAVETAGRRQLQVSGTFPFLAPFSARAVSAADITPSVKPEHKTTSISRNGQTEAPLLDEVIDDLIDRLVIHYGSPSSAPPEALANEKSVQRLYKFTDDVSPPMTEYPPAEIQRLDFHLYSETEGKLSRKVVLVLRTTGGNCKKMVEQSLSSFFQECGLPSKFRWPEGFWELSEAVPIKTRQMESPSTSAAAFNTSEPQAPLPETLASSSQGSEAQLSQDSVHNKGGTTLKATNGEPDAESVETKVDGPPIEEIVEKIDGALEAIASVPWHTDDADKSKIHEQLVCALEKDGWRVQDACIHIWAGERELGRLRLGLDKGSIELVRRILVHASNLDKEHGRKHALLKHIRTVVDDESDFVDTQ